MRALAEYPHAFLEIEGIERIETDRYLVLLGEGDDPRLRSVERLRLSSNPEKEVRAVRKAVLKRGFRDSTWWVGPSTSPPNLVPALIRLGMERHRESSLEMMALCVADLAPRLSGGIEVRPAATKGEVYKALEIRNQAFGIAYEPDLVSRGLSASVDQNSEEVVVLAWHQEFEQPISMGIVSVAEHGAYLATAATLPEARRRGGYSAIVLERCRLAAERGCAWVATQAGSESRPGLTSLGFAELGSITVLVDRLLADQD